MMLRFHKLIFAAAVGLAALSGGARAATVDLDFRLPAGSSELGRADSVSFAQGSLALTVTAGVQAFGRIWPWAQVTRARSGLGVRNAFMDGGQIDGRIGRDLLIFSFDRAVRIEGVGFARVDSDDDAALFVEGGTGALERAAVFDLPSGGWLSTLTLDPAWFGDLFGIGAAGWNDDFRISGLRVSFEDGISATPGPGPFGLILAALGALALALRGRGARA
ncbi:hypothetical protein SAMN05216200_104168 [Oceanicella actignis]|uniref:VPLPA-CTERM protein sorting domain-containing protein n=2 Tax=Oceanicella actignis TaxID=1189325 RepID=A0A1M7T518_9RHOB|nr:hypothetical protein SAMN04488119_104168 [Oceanicella actignis]SHN65806.1 hypothetical protein SAMN05216200_104168 [Oceanicella actignis]